MQWHNHNNSGICSTKLMFKYSLKAIQMVVNLGVAVSHDCASSVFLYHAIVWATVHCFHPKWETCG